MKATKARNCFTMKRSRTSTTHVGMIKSGINASKVFK